MDDAIQSDTARLARLITRQGQKRHLAPIWAAQAGIGPGMVVLDIGAGIGALTLHYATMIGPDGLVFALEPDDQSRTYLLAAAKQAELPVLGLPYPAAALNQIARAPDRVMLTDTLHHADDPAMMLAAIRRVMPAPSRLFIAEYDPTGPGLLGAKMPQRMAPARVLALLDQTGFRPGTVHAAPDEHYCLTATCA
jgi:ubiquinone/menaquinone biosynthesis C-methylase UbiE